MISSAMRFTILLLIMVATASAQVDAGKILEQGLRGVFAGLAPVPALEQAAVLKTTAEMLARHVTFRPEGNDSAICTVSGRSQVEWRRLLVRSITAQAVTEADRLNGVSKRYMVGLSCDAHRSWDAKAKAWGQWYTIGNVLFPSAIVVEWQGGKWVALESDQIKYFFPGPGPSIAPPKPDPKSDGLPPGMTRGQ